MNICELPLLCIEHILSFFSSLQCLPTRLINQHFNDIFELTRMHKITGFNFVIFFRRLFQHHPSSIPFVDKSIKSSIFGNFSYSSIDNEISLSLPYQNLSLIKHVDTIVDIQKFSSAGYVFLLEKKVIFSFFDCRKHNLENLLSIIYDRETNTIDYLYKQNCYPITQIMSDFFDINIFNKYYDCTRAMMIPAIKSDYFYLLSAKTGPLIITKYSTEWKKIDELISCDKYIFLDFHNVIYYCKDMKCPFAFTYSIYFLYALWLPHKVFIRIDRVNNYHLHEVESSLLFSDRLYFVLSKNHQNNAQLISISHTKFNTGLLHGSFQTKQILDKDTTFVFLDQSTLFCRKNDEIFDIDERICEIDLSELCLVTDIGFLAPQ